MITILNGDCRDVLRTLPDASVQCCVTSPPYFNLRDYGVAGQIGLEPTPDDFVAEMVAVFRDVRRVLRDDGVLFLNLGDSYFGSNQTGGTKSLEGSAKRAGRMFSKPVGAQRAIACDTSGTKPEGFQASGCLCGSLCDACRAAYRLGISHNGNLLAPTPAPSIGVSTHEHMVLPPGHLPTLGLTGRGDHSEAAILDPEQASRLAGEPPRDAPVSMTHGSSRRPQAEPPRSGQPSGCLSCGRSLPDCVPASARMGGCTCGTSAPGSASDSLGKGASGLAYPHLTTKALKPKDLIGIPWRVAFALQADGWYLRSDIIWHKPNPMPESVTDRPTSAHEHVFLFSKSERYHYDAEAIKEPAVAAEAEGGPALKRNARNVWTIATRPFPEAHFATFPPELAERCILAGCPAGGTVLDPFGGAGTTGLVADRLQRHAVLIELNPEYAAMAERRIAREGGLFADVGVSQRGAVA